jgi:hypothetical protein
MKEHRMPAMKASSSLNKQEIDEILDFFTRLNIFSHFNHPYWADIVEPYKKPIFIRFYEEGVLSGVATAYCKLSFCIMHFGPVVEDPINLSKYIEQIASYLKETGNGLLVVQQEPETNDSTKLILSQQSWFSKRIFFDETGLNTLTIELVNRTPEDIFRAFSKGHKSAIKKAVKEGIEVRLINVKSELKRLSEIYDDMHHRKGLILPLPDSAVTFNKIFDLKLGHFVGVFMKGELLGGISFIPEGSSLLYKFGATDVKYHNFPVLHVAIYEMIKYAMEHKYQKVDMGGYTSDAKQGSYSFGVNLFKKGFGGEVVDASHSFSIRLNLVKTLFMRTVLIIYNIIPEKVRKMLY